MSVENSNYISGNQISELPIGIDWQYALMDVLGKKIYYVFPKHPQLPNNIRCATAQKSQVLTQVNAINMCCTRLMI